MSNIVVARRSLMLGRRRPSPLMAGPLALAAQPRPRQTGAACSPPSTSNGKDVVGWPSSKGKVVVIETTNH